MYKEPVLGDLSDPLVSLLIYNYDGRYLRGCLEAIFRQENLRNLEVIYMDDATMDGSWEVAVEYAQKYGSLMTVCRNREVRGPKFNTSVCRAMAKGRYCAVLTGDQAFDSDYIRSRVRILAEDDQAEFDSVRRTVDVVTPPPSVLKGPLVSILCYNYNYGRYLRQALSSLFSQTYQNIEVCFSDNASTDESWPIALEFERRHPHTMTLIRNRKNFGASANYSNCWRVMKGKYFLQFCSDDALEPQFVERCVQALESHPNAGMAIVNRAIMDENGRRSEEPPFYNRSCIIPGHEQAAVYMMAGVNPSTSQVMYRRDFTEELQAPDNFLASRYYGMRVFDLKTSLDHDIAYIKDSLLLNRVHRRNDTSHADGLLLPIAGIYVLNHQMADLAEIRGAQKAADRLPQSIDKLATLSIRYSVRMLQAGNEEVALSYYHLAVAINPRVMEDSVWQDLKRYWASDDGTKAEILNKLTGRANLATRSVSYDPPPGSMPLE
jgi:glycosyltransferase involved in cell wall biosynthesis